MFKFIAQTVVASALLCGGVALAAQPCASGSNANCSWTCSNNTFKVTCNNPDGPDRCYVVEGGTSQAAKCSDFSLYNPARITPNPMTPRKKTAAPVEKSR